MMQNVIFEKLLVPANLSPDGESPTKIIVTQEHNGAAVWLQSYSENGMLQWFDYAYTAIEWAVVKAPSLPGVRGAVENSTAKKT